MTKGKIVVIAGTDCSGKETQSKLLFSRLEKEGEKVFMTSYPRYDTQTGKIVGGPYLGKPAICDSYFPEKAPGVDPVVSSFYYAADRGYNNPLILEKLDKGINVILDRYVSANLAHQGGKIFDEKKRLEFFRKIEIIECGLNLEDQKTLDNVLEVYKKKSGQKDFDKVSGIFDIIKEGITGIPKPDQTLFLYMPLWASKKLKGDRVELLDGNESDDNHLLNAEKTYLELVKLNGWTLIDCTEGDRILTPEEIHEKLYEKCCLK